ncbi:MAG TPA: AMP-binding protein [Bacillota bacterium]|jgi:long-chain acyl-CoA synthetase|nr:long-chain fatty acid--CoA ligase [Fastidiosipila sp.]HPX93754.1 AMP-binding protein [Bacillota bacterium]HQB81575.1 AMP-binding protein [Bacillota bacterium]
MYEQFPDFSIVDPSFQTSFVIPDETMYSLVRKTCRERPDEPALSYLGARMTYRELGRQIDDCSRGLMASGFKAGDIFAICMPNTPETVILFYAVNRMGGICNMIHPLAPAANVMEIIRETGSRFLCFPELFLGRLASHIEEEREDSTLETVLIAPMARSADPVSRAGLWLTKARKANKLMPRNRNWIRWDDMIRQGIKEDLSQLEEASDPERVSTYLHSGGTTAEAKTIMLSDRNFNGIACQIFSAIGYPIDAPRPYGEAFVDVLPLFHGFGLCIGMHAMLVNAACCILVPQFSTKGLASIIKKQKPTLMAGVPTLFEAVLNDPVMEKIDFSCFSAMFCGGDSLTPELKERFDRFLAEHGSSARLREGYGLTETVTVCCLTHHVSSDRSGIGLPLANMEMKIADIETGVLKPDGEIGEIYVTGPTVMKGYLHQEKATSETLLPDKDGKIWVKTGDLGYRDPDGFYHFTSRLKRMIKVSGVNVYPLQIENIIAEIPQVLQVAAIGIPHPYQMEVVKVFLRVKEGTDRQALEKLVREKVKERLLPYAVPKEIEFIEEFPKTLVGKIDLKVLEERERQKYQASQ